MSGEENGFRLSISEFKGEVLSELKHIKDKVNKIDAIEKKVDRIYTTAAVLGSLCGVAAAVIRDFFIRS